MQWDSLEAFLAMGGHGRFVWGAYAFTALVMAIDAIASRRRLARSRAAAQEGAEA